LLFSGRAAAIGAAIVVEIVGGFIVVDIGGGCSVLPE
jgi:actin-like ATPase involved in cell morphogenesis